MKRTWIKIIAIMVGLSTLIGCSFVSMEEEPKSLAMQWFEFKHDYVGDVSKDMALLQVLKVREVLGDFTLELQTEEAPYRLEIKFSDTVKDSAKFDAVMSEYAYLLLALIRNVSVIEWSYVSTEELNPCVGVFSEELANQLYDLPVKEVGQTLEQFSVVLEQMTLLSVLEEMK